jgi:hypothetical protein
MVTIELVPFVLGSCLLRLALFRDVSPLPERSRPWLMN